MRLPTLAQSDRVARRRRGAQLARFSVEREPLRAEVLRVADGVAASEAELRLLACCAAQIAAEAGAGSVVHAVGAQRQGALLGDALASVAHATATAASDCVPPGAVVGSGAHRRRRPVVYLPGDLVAAAGLGQVDVLLCRAAAQHGDDALAVIAVEAPASHAATAHAAAPCALGHQIACLRANARKAGWEFCQLWTDGMARHALVVLERAVGAALLGACTHEIARNT